MENKDIIALKKMVKDSDMYKQLLAIKENEVLLLKIAHRKENPQEKRYDCSICGCPQIIVYGGNSYKNNPKFIKMTSEFICDRCYENKGVFC